MSSLTLNGSSNLFPLQASTPTPYTLSGPTVKVSVEDLVGGDLQMRDTAFVSAVQACLSQTLVLPPHLRRALCLMLQFVCLCGITPPRLLYPLCLHLSVSRGAPALPSKQN